MRNPILDTNGEGTFEGRGKTLTWLMAILLVLSLSVSCEKKPPPPPEQPPPPQELPVDPPAETETPTGCCQVTADSCASPVTAEQCEEMSGLSFHEGGTCRTDGQCGVLQEE